MILEGRTYGEMIITTNHMSVAELTEGVFHKWTNLIQAICQEVNHIAHELFE